MRFLFPFALLLLLAASGCGEEDPITPMETDITLGGENLDIAGAFVRYTNIEPPSSSQISLELLGAGSTITEFGEVTNTPTDRLRLSLVVPNTDGEILSGTYPVSRVLPTETMYVSNGTLMPGFSSTSQSFLEVQSGSLEVSIDNDMVTLVIDLIVSENFDGSNSRQVSGTTEIPLERLP